MSKHVIENSNPAAAGSRWRRGKVTHLGETSRERREHAESLLGRFGELSAGEVRDLLDWYHREASAMDMALVASNPRIANAYRAFRREHIDRFNRKEKLIGTLLATGALGLLGAVALLGYE